MSTECSSCQENRPCTSCTDTSLIIQNYCDDGCAEYTGTDCVKYDGQDVAVGSIAFSKGDKLTKVITELLKNTYNVSLDVRFDPISRSLCLIKDGVSIRCVTIGEQDDQYLRLSGNILQIWKPSNSPTTTSDDVKINEVDLSAIIANNKVGITSTSLSVSTQANNNQQFTIDVTPSGDTGNIMVIGSDGKPYVPNRSVGVTDVNITPDECFSYIKTTSVNGVVSFQQVVDWSCVASKICGLCNSNPCTPATNLTVTSV